MISRLDSTELLKLVRNRKLEPLELLEVLRSPFCTAQIAEHIAADRRLLSTHGVRELLAGYPGFSLPRALDLLATLPWASLLNVAQNPRSTPVVRRHAERRLLAQIPQMTLGEKIALARRAHRAMFRQLTSSGDSEVLEAMLDNPRVVENDLVVLINTRDAGADFLSEVARHRKWGRYRGVRRAIITSPSAPIPLALSLLVELGPGEIRSILEYPKLRDGVRRAATSLLEREASRRRRVIHSDGGNGRGGPTQSPEDLR